MKSNIFLEKLLYLENQDVIFQFNKKTFKLNILENTFIFVYVFLFLKSLQKCINSLRICYKIEFKIDLALKFL